MKLANVSRVMATQHPDNITIPSFTKNDVLQGEDEIQEAYYSFATLGIGEQLWDSEGKEVDTFVVKKLLSRYPDYFKKQVLGKDVFLPLRVPNPSVERDEGRILLEALHSIPRSAELAGRFYGNGAAPLFEVFLPMCSSEKELLRVHRYYQKFIVGVQKKRLLAGDLTIQQWLGDVQPKDIRVTPLFETKEALLQADRLVAKYIAKEKIKDQQRVWLARSDPALNYGSLANVLLAKISLQRLQKLEERTSVEILPILGCGSAPFRGNFRPSNVESMMHGYPSVQTFTAQSAFRYDSPENEVQEAIQKITEVRRKAPLPIEEKFGERLIGKIEEDYQKVIPTVAPLVNILSPHVPARRKRKLHIDLFGYARKSAGVHLPRAIPFCASLYSLGLSPELFGLSTVTPQELDRLRSWYKTIDQDMADALRWHNPKNLHLLPSPVQRKVLQAKELFSSDTIIQDEEHAAVTSRVAEAFAKGDWQKVKEGIVEAARIRRFLG